VPARSRDLERAFRGTEYRVTGRPPLALRCGRASAGLRAWMRAHQAASAAMLTAWNPGALPRPAQANRRAQARLERALRDLKPLALRRGSNRDLAGRWPAEPSLWALGLSLAQARALAARFGQAAILYCGPSARPRLHWI